MCEYGGNMWRVERLREKGDIERNLEKNLEREDPMVTYL